MEVLFLVALTFVLFSFPTGRIAHTRAHLISSRIIYSLFICLLVFSPLYTTYLIDLFGGTVDVIENLPLIAAAGSLSLPASILIARLSGPTRYADYVGLVESASRVRLSNLTILWVAVFGMLIAATLLASIMG